MPPVAIATCPKCGRTLPNVQIAAATWGTCRKHGSVPIRWLTNSGSSRPAEWSVTGHRTDGQPPSAEQGASEA